jgi:hypothetical protein
MSLEFGGIIEEVRDDVTHVILGQRAVVRATIFDGTCTACKQGYNYCCENIGFVGLTGMPWHLSKSYRSDTNVVYPSRVRWRHERSPGLLDKVYDKPLFDIKKLAENVIRERKDVDFGRGRVRNIRFPCDLNVLR